MSSRQDALEQIAEIARRHALSSAEIRRALEASPSSPERRSTHLLGRILGALGGIFVFAGLGVFIATNWEVMNAAARIIITFGSGMVAFILALAASKDERGRRFTTPLYLIAAALQPIGILVALDEFSTGSDWHLAGLLTAGIMTLQQGATLWKRRDAVLLFTTILFGLWLVGTALDYMDVDDDFNLMLLGACAVGLCAGLERTPYRGVTPFWYLVGSAAFFGGLFSLLQGSAIELAFLLVACGGVYLSIAVRSRTLLLSGTVAILGYISYFTGEHFLDSLGWPMVLILLGLSLIGLSAAAVRINRRYISRANDLS